MEEKPPKKTGRGGNASRYQTSTASPAVSHYQVHDVCFPLDPCTVSFITTRLIVGIICCPTLPPITSIKPATVPKQPAPMLQPTALVPKPISPVLAPSAPVPKPNASTTRVSTTAANNSAAAKLTTTTADDPAAAKVTTSTAHDFATAKVTSTTTTTHISATKAITSALHRVIADNSTT
jgi:hypothetical protein